MLKKIFGNNLKKYRLKRKMTQEQLAELIDVSVQYISRLETGKHSPSLSTVEDLSWALNIRPFQFFEEEK